MTYHGFAYKLFVATLWLRYAFVRSSSICGVHSVFHVGAEVGAEVGVVVGADVGAEVGDADVGADVGAEVGAEVGVVGADVGVDVQAAADVDWCMFSAVYFPPTQLVHEPAPA